MSYSLQDMLNQYIIMYWIWGDRESHRTRLWKSWNEKSETLQNYLIIIFIYEYIKDESFWNSIIIICLHVWDKTTTVHFIDTFFSYLYIIFFIAIYFGNWKIMFYHYIQVYNHSARCFCADIFYSLKSWQLIEIKILILSQTNSGKENTNIITHNIL